jgi:hypothetical protein
MSTIPAVERILLDSTQGPHDVRVSTTMSVSLLVLTIVLKLGKTPKEMLARAKAILTALTGNANFTTPSPTLAVLQAAVAAVEQAQVAMGLRGPAAARNAKLKAMVALFKHLRDYLQSTCELQPELFAAMAESAAVYVMTRTVRPKQVLAATWGLLSGEVDLVAQAPDGKSATHYWQYSLDQKTWLVAADTSHCKTTITGLTPGQTYYFRHASMVKNVRSDWSQIVSLLVK